MTSRQIFSEAEKICLQELIVKYKLNISSTLTGHPGVKKIAWNRLTEEYNCIETNSKRTESQLKKCWENLKTRQKTILAYEKRQRLMTGGGSYTHTPTYPGTSTETLIPEALSQQTDVELTGVIDSDSGFIYGEIIMELDDQKIEDDTLVGSGSPSLETGSITATAPHPTISTKVNASCDKGSMVDTPLRPRSTISRLSEHRGNTSQGQRHIRTKVIEEEFNIRKETYIESKEREDILHKLKVAEREWMVKAAEEVYTKSKIEREAAYQKAMIEKETAEVLLKHTKLKAELSELELKNRKYVLCFFFINLLFLCFIKPS